MVAVNKKNSTSELEEAFQEFLNEKTLKGMQSFMLFTMFNYFADQVADNAGKTSAEFKKDFFNTWKAVAKECNQLELGVINDTLLDSDETYSAQILGQPSLSTEDYQKKYDQAIEEAKKVYFHATGLI